MIFDDKSSLYLARNILPAISLITLENTTKKSNEKIAVQLDRKRFANLLTNGIMNDYADLEIEE
jgi:N-acetylmuramoyl-L-alanine amidase